MKKIIYKVILGLILVIFLIAGTCWFYSDQILDQLVRPQLEKAAAQLLEGQVQIRQMVWTETGLEILDLTVNIPPQILVEIPHLELNFTPSSLWNRQLDSLRVIEPQIEIVRLQKQEESAKTAITIPKQLPLTIAQLTVTDGLLMIHSGEQQWQLHELNFSGALRLQSHFELSTFFGPDEKHPVMLTGTVEFSRQKILSLESLSWQGNQLLTAPLQLILSGTDFALGRNTLRLKQFDHSKLRGILTAMGQPSLLPEEMNFSLTDTTIVFALEDQILNLEGQVTKGRIGWDKLSGNFTQLKLQLHQEHEGWQISGQFRGPAKSNCNFSTHLDNTNSLTGQALVKIPDPGSLKTELFGGPTLQIAGGLQLTAKYSLQGNRFQLTTEISGFQTEQPDDDYLLNVSELNGHGKLSLNNKKEKLSFNLVLASHLFLSVNGNFQNLNFSLTPAGLNDIKKLLPPGQIPVQIQSANGLRITGKLSRKATDWSGNIRLEADEVALPELSLNKLEARGILRLVSDQVRLKESSIDFTLVRGDELSTQVNIQTAGIFSQRGFSLTLQQLSLAHLNYMSPDGLSGLGEATIKLQGDIRGAWLKEPLALELNGTFAAEEILVGEFYADLSTYQGNLFLAGNFIPTRKELTADSVRIHVPQLGTLTSTGRFNPKRISTQGHIELTDLVGSYGKHIGPLLSEFKPALAGLSLKGGISLDYNLIWSPEAWQTNGTLQLRGLDAYWQRQRLKIIDGNGSIPFALTSEQASTDIVPGAEYSGEISFGTLSAGLATLKHGRLELSASSNRFTFLSPLLLQLAGGQVVIENLTLGWPDNKPQGSVKINISKVDLNTLTRELGWPVMQGQVSADLGTIHYADRQLSTEGLASIEVFGGRFQLRNMSYSEPFSSYPTFHTDIDFSGLNLLQATRTFDFGEMNGILDGYIHGLKLFGTSPAAFNAAIATRNGGKRNISVKALNNLSIIGQGGISAALSRGIYRFINFYRYQKIGFKCSLNNDTFTLLGTALSGSDKYLIRGGLLPPRIDITTTTPTISFKEMMNRLSRIDRAGN